MLPHTAQQYLCFITHRIMAAIDPKLLKDYQRLAFQQQRQILCAGRILEALLLRRQGQTASDDVLMLGINRELVSLNHTL